MKESSKYERNLLSINSKLLRYLMGAISFCLILGTISVTKSIIIGLIKSPLSLVNVTFILSDSFQSVLYILIGYELFEALRIVVTSRAIPDLPIIRIAIIALANKVIAINPMLDDYKIMLGLAALLISLSIASFCLKLKDIVHTFRKGDRGSERHTVNYDESPNNRRN